MKQFYNGTIPMSGQSSKYPTKFQKVGDTVLADKTCDSSLVPVWKGNEPILDPKYLGIPKGRPSNEVLETRENLKQRFEQYGEEINPVTGYGRALSVLKKLEELGMKGDVNAAKLFLERVAGKIKESLDVRLNQFEGVSDAELIEQLRGIKFGRNGTLFDAETVEVPKI